MPNLFQHLTPLQAQYSHNTRLQEDAAASVGVNHCMYKVAATYVRAFDEQMMSMLRVTPNDLKKIKGEKFDECERALLKWTGIDLTATVM